MPLYTLPGTVSVTLPNEGQQTMANSISVAIASDQTGQLDVDITLSSTASSPTVASVGVASTAVIASNAARRGLSLTNNSTARISLNMAGGAAVLDSGVTLYPGQTFTMGPQEYTTAAINGIASAAASAVGIQEFT